MSNPEWYDPKKLLDSVRAQSLINREKPVEFFKQFLSDIWKDNLPDEALHLWQVKVEHFPWYAADALFCLTAVINDPPKNLIDIMAEHGWIMLYHEMDESGEEALYRFDEYVAWLTEMRDQFKAVYDAFPANEADLAANEEE